MLDNAIVLEVRLAPIQALIDWRYSAPLVCAGFIVVLTCGRPDAILFFPNRIAITEISTNQLARDVKGT